MIPHDAVNALNRDPLREFPENLARKFSRELMIEDDDLIHPHDSRALALNIMAEVMPYRRMSEAPSQCVGHECLACITPHFSKVIHAITSRKPILFVLPAFPGKSPNTNKVFGPLPDLAERHSLVFLNSLCTKIQRIYSPGAKIIICSDGRVFSDIIGMKEDDVSAYHEELENIIDELNLAHLSVYKLDDIYRGQDFRQARERLVSEYGKPLDFIRNKVRRGGDGSLDYEDNEAHRIYCGITRFLVEDALYPGQTKTRSAIQRECRHRAYEVISRSNAWSDHIAVTFPSAVRLSIHPQACGSRKMGIQLLKGERWMTPWHGVAVLTNGEVSIMKRWEAENLGAKVVLDKTGRPSHFRI